MSALINYKYASLLSGHLCNYKLQQTAPFRANFRCPICWDSSQKENSRKAYLLEKNGNYVFYCHRMCTDKAVPLGKFLKDYYPDLYSQYSYEEYAEKTSRDLIAGVPREPDPILDYTKPKHEIGAGVLKGVKRISQLPHDHKAKLYVQSRKIPTPAHARLYFHPNFTTWINTLIPGRFEKVPKIDPRLIIPLIDRKGNVFAVQGRALTSKQEIRYITIRFDEEMPKLFGLDKVDPNRRMYVLEGPLDSLFLPNAIAMAGAGCSSEKIMECSGSSKERLVYVFDNEPRGINIHKQMSQLMDNGFNVCIWPSHIKEKDINAMVLAGREIADIQQIIDENLYTGLAGHLQMSSWVKV